MGARISSFLAARVEPDHLLTRQIMLSLLKPFIVFGALLNVTTAFSNDEGLSAVEQRVFDLMNRGFRLSSSEIARGLGNDRDATLTLLKKVATREVTEFICRDGARLQLPGFQARSVLLRLPDPEVLETVGKQLQTFTMESRYYSFSDDLFGEVVRSKQPKLLPYLAKGMFRPGDAVTIDLDLGKYRKYNWSSESFFQLMKLTEAVEEFSPGVRGWARAMRGAHHLSYEEKREIGRIWWKENEAAILAADYASVRPGISPAEGLPRSKPESVPKPDEARRVLPLQAGTGPALENESGHTPGLPVAFMETASTQRSWLIGGGIAAFAAAISAWIVFRQRRGPGEGK